MSRSVQRNTSEFEVGQLVLMRNRESSIAQAYRTAVSNKPFYGSWVITKNLLPTAYQLSDFEERERVNRL